MARAAEGTGGGGSPFAKFNERGDTLIAAFGGGKSRQQQDFKEKKPKFKDDGKPLLEEVMHFVAMPGTTAKTGTPDNPETIEAADIVRFSVSGYKWGQVIDERKNLPEYAGYKAGTPCSGDVYTITLVGWSAETENAAGATKAGYTVVDGRIVLRSTEEHEKWVLMRLRGNQNTNAAKDFTISIRRPNADEKRWEQAADELFDSKPWERVAATVGGGESADHDDNESF